jgi:hypothetical protein
VALAIDASSPGVAAPGNATSVTTPNALPISNSLLLVGLACNSKSGLIPAQAPSITDSLGSHLTYTSIDSADRGSLGIDGQVATWWATPGSSTSMTITVTNREDGTPTHDMGLKVWVLTGHDTVTPIGAHNKAGATSGSAIAQSYTAQATSGQGFIVVTDWGAVGTETAGTGCTMDASGTINTNQISYGFARRTLADDSNGVSNTLNVTLPSASTNYMWCYVEVRPAAGAAATKTPGYISQHGFC